jgi:hypothetical protein
MNLMLSRLFPKCIDNRYQGHRVAVWLFAVLLFMKSAMGINCIFNGYSVAESADGIPIDTFTAAGTQTVVSMFAIWGLCQFLFGLFGVLVLTRYRAMVPLFFAMLLLEQLMRKLVLSFLPVVRTGTPPGYLVNLVFLALMIVGLTLSLWSKGELRRPE